MRCPNCKSENIECREYTFTEIDGKREKIKYYICLDCLHEFEKMPITNKDYVKALKLLKEKLVETSYVLENDNYEDYISDMNYYYDRICNNKNEERKKEWLKSWCLTEEEWYWLKEVFENVR